MTWIEAAIAAAAFALVFSAWFIRRRRGVTTSYSVISADAWAGFAASNGLMLLPHPQWPVMSGDFGGVPVRVQGTIQKVEGRRGISDRQTYVVSTTFEAAIRCQMPEGMHLRRQRTFDALADAIVSGGEILVEDDALDKRFLIHGKDPEAVAAIVLHPPVRAGLLALASVDGEVVVDELKVRFHAPRYVTESVELRFVMEGLTRCVRGIREQLPPSGEPASPPEPNLASATGTPATSRHTPLPGALRLPTLPSLLRRAAGAGMTTQVGRSMLDAITAEGCTFEVDVERVLPYLTRVGSQDGVCVMGELVGDASRIEVRFGKDLEGAIPQGIGPGARISGIGYLESYDTLRNRAEVIATVAPQILRAAPPGSHNASATPAPAGKVRLRTATAPSARIRAAAAPAAAVLSDPTYSPPHDSSASLAAASSAPAEDAGIVVEGLQALLEILGAASATLPERLQLIAGLKDARYPLQLEVRKVERTAGFRVNAEMRGGRSVVGRLAGTSLDVETRFPAHRNEELDLATPGAIVEATIAITEWDGFYDRVVLEAQPEAQVTT
jgi:hypothetical protein